MNMNRIALFTIVAGLATLAANVHADPKATEPARAERLVVCRDYKVMADKKAEDRPVAVCFDTKRPVVLRYFSEVTVVTAEGPAKVVVGSR
jgi:hypothetical protein